MTRSEILEELLRLPMGERLAIAEAALRGIREELRKHEAPAGRPEEIEKLAAAAKALLPDYAAGGDLTSFTSLDAEDFRG
jgi:hypothetical protein